MASSHLASSALDFDASTLPWVDRDDFDSELDRRLAARELTEADAALLRSWRRDGYVILPDKMNDDLVESLLNDYERCWQNRPEHVNLLIEGLGVTAFPDAPPRDDLGHHHYRVLDIQDTSRAARQMILHAKVVHALRLIFDDTPVAMQSLFFEYGSEQRTHQDFPYVQSNILSHLVGCWMACDDVDDDNGPLFYYPGSHRLPKFDWSDGEGKLSLETYDDAIVDRFGDHLEEQAEKAGLERKIFHTGRGDVLLWHGALAHGGSRVKDQEPTRRSLVVHYSSRTAYPRDRRNPTRAPAIYERNGGMLYDPFPPSFFDRIKDQIRRFKSAFG